jgi:xanthine dehydrogenase YagS FAD-binding subunit
MRPGKLVDINALAPRLSQVQFAGDRLQLGALTRMAEVADHKQVIQLVPMLAQSLALAASDQIRNMASLGGNVLQRTRCPYFRDPSWSACNKRNPGSGCAALEGVNRLHAILGTSDACIATYPGDFGQALIALDAVVEIQNGQGMRTLPFAQLHRKPGATPHLETTLAAGELITGFAVPLRPWLKRSVFIKVRDRQSYEFAVASAAVALDLQGGVVREARIGLGGMTATPWRAREAEAALRGKQLTPQTADDAAKAALAGAVTRRDNGFKLELGRRTIVRALLAAQALEV